MSVYKRDSSPYYTYDFTYRGKRYRGSTQEKTEQLARIVESDLMQKARQGHKDALLGNAPTLQEFSVEFLKWVEDTHSLDPGTKRYYKNGWRLLKLTPLAKRRMDEIANHACETLNFPGGAATANAALRTMRRMFTKAQEVGKIFSIPKIKLRKEWGRSIAMTTADAALIASRMPEGRAKDAFIVIRHSGPVRPWEVFSMRWEYMHLADGYYHNPKGKSKRARRTMPIFREAVEVLKRRHLAAGMPTEGWVFPSPKSKHGHLATIAKVFTRARDKAGLPKAMVLYTARHGQATDVGAIVSTKELMDMGGWSDAASAMRYQHPDTAALQAKLEAAQITGRIQ